MDLQSRICGFTVTGIKESEELGGKLVYLKHDKLETEVVWLDNGELNKLFSISFMTLPKDSTGVFHILEHSVLCGSEKFPVKEPFVDLLKSSMNTFLNAMTFQDKTMYPVSSRNEKDFLNLTEVYLDAVFAPAILKNRNIFYQEGWHIEQDENGRLSYKGVVFNEMKGVMSGKDGLIGESLLPVIFPDTCYGYNSGGDPDVIPQLSYEQFIETYKQHYHPSNAKIYLDGSIPVEKTLRLIDSYLSKYEKLDRLPKLTYQKPKSAEKTIYYAIAEDEDEKDKAQLTLAKIFGSWDDPVKTMAASTIFGALADSNDSPFKKAVLESGLAQDLEFYISEESAQVYLTIDAKNVKDGCEEQLIALIRRVAKEQVENGIDKKALIASINTAEFKYRSPDEPAALYRNIRAMQSWLYGGDPIIYLESGNAFNKLRDMLKTDAYEKLLSKLLLDDSGRCILKSLPSKTCAAEKDAKETEKLDALKASWTSEEFDANALLNEELVCWQQTPDSPEQTAMLPKLPLSEIESDFDYTKTEEYIQAGVKVLYHPVKTNGIVHMAMYFNMADKSLEEITKLSAYAGILSYVSTKKHSTLELEQEIKTYLGSLNFSLGAFSDKNEFKTCTPYLIASCSVLKENVSHAKELIFEIISSTVFDKEEIRNILLQGDMRARQAGIVSGHSLGRTAALSHYSADDAINEALSGVTNNLWLHDVTEHFDDYADDLLKLYEGTLKEVCTKRRLVLSITADEFDDYSDFINMFEDGQDTPVPAEYVSALAFNLGCKIPALIGFAVQGCSLNAIGEKYDGSLAVAANILSLDYFWNKVRVQGGAYGTGFRIGMGGSMFTYSYRDPGLKNTIDTNKGAAEYLREYCQNNGEIDKYIISSIAATEPLLSPQAKGAIADRDYFCRYTYETVKAQREQILACDYGKLLHAADIIDKFSNQGALCVFGSDEKLKEFDNLEVINI